MKSEDIIHKSWWSWQFNDNYICKYQLDNGYEVIFVYINRM